MNHSTKTFNFIYRTAKATTKSNINNSFKFTTAAASSTTSSIPSFNSTTSSTLPTFQNNNKSNVTNTTSPSSSLVQNFNSKTSFLSLIQFPLYDDDDGT